jgi:hypothetical protein
MHDKSWNNHLSISKAAHKVDTNWESRTWQCEAPQVTRNITTPCENIREAANYKVYSHNGMWASAK